MEKATMIDYIQESAEVCLANIKQGKTLIQSLLDCFLEWEYEKILIIASGSSANAAECVRYFMQDFLYCDVEIVSPYTFTNYTKYIDDKTFVFTISQSGASTNTIEAIKRIKAMNRKAIVLTGDICSDVAIADVVVDYGVGKESVGFVTKGVNTLALYLCLFSLHTSYQLEYLSMQGMQKYINQLEAIYKDHPKLTSQATAFYKQHRKEFLGTRTLIICGVGPNMGTAKEGALKVTETVKIPTIAFEVEEYIHGPNLQINPSYTVIFIDNNDVCSKRIQDIWKATTCITDRSYLLSAHVDGENVYTLAHEVLPSLSALSYLIFFQVLAYQMTNDTNQWKDYILMDDFQKVVKSKTK
ncbi:hypothetical protein A4S06_01255 [Erysipelotrichaceae bacterium MTC7]|nr:hypothetical protein A4S06_01255 [Erysipelotrichaceae bacterium MTC7]